MFASLSPVSVPLSGLLDSVPLSALILALFSLLYMCWLAGQVGADMFGGIVEWGEPVVKWKSLNESGEAAPH